MKKEIFRKREIKAIMIALMTLLIVLQTAVLTLLIDNKNQIDFLIANQSSTTIIVNSKKPTKKQFDDYMQDENTRLSQKLYDDNKNNKGL